MNNQAAPQLPLQQTASPSAEAIYTAVEALDMPALHARRAEILASVPDHNFKLLGTEAVRELLAINRALVKKNSGPPKAAKPATSDKPKGGKNDAPVIDFA